LPSECIWQSTVQFSGRRTIGKLYPELEDFFRKDIGVVTQDVVMLLEEILNLAELVQAKDKDSVEDQDHSQAVDRIKELMVNAGQVIQAARYDEDVNLCLKKLQDCCFIPCRLGKSKSLQKPRDSFYLVDNERYGVAFANSLRFPDFDHAEMTSVYPLLDAVDHIALIYVHGLSQHVDVEVTVEDSSPNQILSSFLRERAYAISWYGCSVELFWNYSN
jgi:hypothetical protein